VDVSEVVLDDGDREVVLSLDRRLRESVEDVESVVTEVITEEFRRAVREGELGWIWSGTGWSGLPWVGSRECFESRLPRRWSFGRPPRWYVRERLTGAGTGRDMARGMSRSDLLKVQKESKELLK